MPKKSHKKLIITLVILAALAGLITFGIFRIRKNAEEVLKQLTSYETATIEKRSIVDSVAATGKIASIDTKTITPIVTGVKVTEVNVKVGDEVKAGDVLVRLDSSDMEKTLENLKTTQEVADSQSNTSVNSAYKSLKDLKTNKEIQVGRAQEAVDEAKQNLDDQMARAQAAWKKYDDAFQKAKEDPINTGSTFYYLSSNDSHFSLEYGTTLGMLYTEFNTANSACVNYEKVYNQAVNSLEDVGRQYDSQISAAQTSYNTAKLSASTTGLNNEAQLKNYEEQIEACTVIAPIDGVVTMVNANAGDRFLGGAIATINDISEYEVTAEIDEYDIGKIKLGQRAVIKTNGTGDEVLDGKVSSIAPRATAGMGTGVTYTVKALVTTPNDLLRMDMTAKLSIVIDEVKDVLTVPFEAIHTDDDGRFYVEIAGEKAPDEERDRIYVNKGLESSYYVEVYGDDVREGIEIVVPSAKGTNLLSELLSESAGMGGF